MSDPTEQPLRGSSIDAIVALYAKDIDMSVIRENVRLTPQQRSEKFARAMRLVFELRSQVARRQQERVDGH